MQKDIASGPRPAARAGRRVAASRTRRRCERCARCSRRRQSRSRCLAAPAGPRRAGRRSAIPGRQRHPGHGRLSAARLITTARPENFAGDLGVGSRSRTDRESQGSRPDPGDRLAARRRGDAGLHAARHGRQRADHAGVAARRPRSGGCSAPRSASSPTSTRSPRPLATLEPVQPAWAQLDPGTARSLREAQRAVPELRGPLNLGTCMRELETTADAGRDRHDGCRQLRWLGDAVSSISRTSSAISARPTARWAIACRQRSARRSRSRTAWWSAWSATAVS